MKLQKRDIDILWELYNDSRQPYSSISKKVKLPKETVKYKIEKFIENKLINKFFVLTNSSNLGLIFYQVFVKTQGMSKEELDIKLKELRNYPNIGWLISTSGKFNFLASFLVKSPSEFYDLFWKMRSLLGEKFGEYNVNIAVTGEQYEYPFFKGRNYSTTTTAHLDLLKPKLDITDVELLSILSENARELTRNIAHKLEITEKTTRERIKKLEKNGSISKYSVQLHPGRAGYYFYMMLIRVKNNLVDIEKYTKTIPEIFYSVKGVGFFDLQLEFYCETEERIYNIEEEIFSKFGSSIYELDILYIKKEYAVNYFVKSIEDLILEKES